MASAISKFLVKIFGSRNERLVKSYMHTALSAGEFEEEIKSLNDDALKAKTQEFKDRLAKGTNPDEILPEAFAVVREAASLRKQGEILGLDSFPPAFVHRTDYIAGNGTYHVRSRYSS